MDIRIRFEKHGNMAYLGHLDLMRCFQKAIRRANMPIKYSAGFHPHPVMSFAQPLSVGLTSNGEYMDATVTEEVNTTKILGDINRYLQPGIKVNRVTILPEKAENAMSSVAAASYRVAFRGNIPDEGLLNEAVKRILDKSEILYEKTTKKGKKTEDIRGYIFDLYVSDGEIYLFLKTGSQGNLPPQVVVSLMLKEIGINCGEYSLDIKRLETYKNIDVAYYPLDYFSENIVYVDMPCRLQSPYYMMGKVIRGKGLGRKVGMPTANMDVDAKKLDICHGVYGSCVTIDGKKYLGLTNIGMRPSVDDELKPTIETFILDYDDDCYGKIILLELFSYIRGVHKFEDLEAVAAQVQKDEEVIRHSLYVQN